MGEKGYGKWERRKGAAGKVRKTGEGGLKEVSRWIGEKENREAVRRVKGGKQKGRKEKVK